MKCKFCKKQFTKKSWRAQKYCSIKCRNKRNSQKSKVYNKEWARKKRAEYAPGKLQCIICDGWYVQVGTHVIQRHKKFLTAKQYKEYFDLPIKKGITPKWYKELKAEICKNNGTIKNMKGGKKFWYHKKDPRAKLVTGWKGRTGNLGYKHNNHY
jgi:hypothetical protein